MTKKDYIALAKALNDAFPISENVTPIDTWRYAVCAVADALKLDNPSFDGERFINAVVTGSVSK